MIRLLTHPFQSSVSKLPLFLGLPVCRWSSLLTGDGGEVGLEPDQEAWPSINRFNTLWFLLVGFPLRGIGRRTKNQRQPLIREVKTGFELAIIPVKDSAAVAQRESNDDLSENFPGSLFL
jgi:hypothetical protein